MLHLSYTGEKLILSIGNESLEECRQAARYFANATHIYLESGRPLHETDHESSVERLIGLLEPFLVARLQAKNGARRIKSAGFKVPCMNGEGGKAFAACRRKMLLHPKVIEWSTWFRFRLELFSDFLFMECWLIFSAVFIL